MVFSSQLRQCPQMIIALDKYTGYMFTSSPNFMMSSSVAMEILCNLTVCTTVGSNFDKLLVRLTCASAALSGQAQRQCNWEI